MRRGVWRMRGTKAVRRVCKPRLGSKYATRSPLRVRAARDEQKRCVKQQAGARGERAGGPEARTHRLWSAAGDGHGPAPVARTRCPSARICAQMSQFGSIQKARESYDTEKHSNVFVIVRKAAPWAGELSVAANLLVYPRHTRHGSFYHRDHALDKGQVTAERYRASLTLLLEHATQAPWESPGADPA